MHANTRFMSEMYFMVPFFVVFFCNSFFVIDSFLAIFLHGWQPGALTPLLVFIFMFGTLHNSSAKALVGGEVSLVESVSSSQLET